MSTARATRRRKPDQASARIDARLTAEQKDIIQRAADLESRSISDFVIANAYKAAKQVIREHDTIVLAAEESRRFADLLLNPPEAGDRLRAAAEQYRSCVAE